MGWKSKKDGTHFNTDKTIRSSEPGTEVNIEIDNNSEEFSEGVRKEYGNSDDLSYDDLEKELTSYFESFDWNLIKHQFNSNDKNIRSPPVSTILLSEFDDESDSGYDNPKKKIKVMFVGTQNHIYSDQIAGQTGEAKDEVFNDYFLMGKGTDIIQKHLGNDYQLYVRDEDVFIIKGL